MTLTDYMETGVKKATSVAELARVIGTTREHASAAKSMRKPLPLDAAVRLADYIETDLRKVLAANELVTEKKEDKRAFWSHLAKAASVALALGLVTNFVTPSPAEAAQTQQVCPERLCIMLSRTIRRHSKKTQLTRTVQVFIKGLLETLQASFPRRILKV